MTIYFYKVKMNTESFQTSRNMDLKLMGYIGKQVSIIFKRISL